MLVERKKCISQKEYGKIKINYHSLCSEYLQLYIYIPRYSIVLSIFFPIAVAKNRSKTHYEVIFQQEKEIQKTRVKKCSSRKKESGNVSLIKNKELCNNVSSKVMEAVIYICGRKCEVFLVCMSQIVSDNNQEKVTNDFH